MMKKSNIYILIIVVIVIVGAVIYGLTSAKKSYSSSSNQNKVVAASSKSKPATSAKTINNSVVVTKSVAGIGNYLATPSDYALYTYSGDKPGVNNCSGSCLALWPAYQDTKGTTNLPSGFGTIKRKDNGQIQFTYNGMPLYTFSSDKPGEVTGNGVAGFSVARP